MDLACNRRTIATRADNEDESRPEKRARTSCSAGSCLEPRSEMNTTDLESDLEVELLEARSQGSLRKNVNIHLAEKIQAAPKGWNSSKPQRQLTFQDLKWKPLEKDEDKALQWKRLAKLDKEMWQEVEFEEEKNKAQQKVHQRELAAKRQQRWRDRQRVLTTDTNIKDCRRSINNVSNFQDKQMEFNKVTIAGVKGLTCGFKQA